MDELLMPSVVQECFQSAKGDIAAIVITDLIPVGVDKIELEKGADLVGREIIPKRLPNWPYGTVTR